MADCCFCGSGHEATKPICDTCLEWLEAEAVPGADETLTSHDRANALLLVDSLQDGKAITAKAFDLIRKCIVRSAEYRECPCHMCRRERKP